MMHDDTPAVPGGVEIQAERIGNVAREEAAVLAEFMDDNAIELLGGKVYNEDYKFVGILTDDLNHKAAGYGISLVLLSNNSDAWTKKFMSILRSKNIDAIKLEMK